MYKYKSIISTLLKPYSSVLFLNNSMAGVVLLLITFINPSVAFSGLAAVAFTIVFAEFLNLKETYYFHGFYIYNSLLMGMGVGYIFYPSIISILLIGTLSIFTFMLSFMLNRLFGVYKIPILSLPFSIVTIFAYLASLKYSGLLSTLVNNSIIYDISLPLIISGFFKSIGTIVFLPNNIAGMMIFTLVLFHSRIIAIMALVGFYFGVFVHSYLIASFSQALSDFYAFNYILVAVALCGIFLLPTLKNFLLALIGVAISVVLTDAIVILFNYYSIPVFTLPFNITVIVFIFILSIVYYKEFNVNIKSTPEESLSSYLSTLFRFGEKAIKIALPFEGEWFVYQGFDDKWTHKGKYQYAYDFVQTYNGKSFKTDGKDVEDYFCFGMSVVAPISGYIVDARADLPDNLIGEVDHINNWGNYIIIKSDLGFYVEISHLMSYSLGVSIGDYVQEGSLLAKCGNSGYSPEPHIHIQVQESALLGSFTMDFCISEYYQGNKLILNTNLKAHDSISSVSIDKKMSSKFLFILDDTFTYEVYENNTQVDTVTFLVKMNNFGEFYFEDASKAKLFFFNDLKQFYFYNYIGGESHLKELFKLIPRIPFLTRDNVQYTDYLPLYLIKTKMQSIYTELLCTINKDTYKVQKNYRYNKSCIDSQSGKVCIEDSSKGFSLIKYANTELRRIV